MKLLGKVLPLTLASVVATVYGAPDDQTVSGQATVSTHVGGAMSFDEVMAVAHEIQQKAVGDYQHVLHLQAIARKEKDVIKLNCVNDKLIQIKPYLNIADHTRIEIETRGAGDEAERMTLHTEMTQVGDNVHRLREEADQCVGELGVTEGENTVVGPHFPMDPFGNPFGDGLEPPGYASPIN
jgi:hypothetical protein